ncbi:dihydrolipoamide acetyltransferase family protein [Amycolatopsis jejuensis]|uniref:dihydrolipoamide acetyltransferase family protein n=1 Tax=Amycolatopsis jejuensis TaxID=330084 RepID=UPI000525D22C|nr:dihydrolipoamide acetyltransferase family protein [Amycolatopsis jejuensis]
MTAVTFQLPDVGEGLTEADIVGWHVAVGDTVAVNQIIVDIETAKSVVELPSPYAGEVVELLAAAGETVAVGAPIIAIRTAAPESEPKLLVGYGVRETGPPRRRRGTSAPVTSSNGAERTKPRAKPPVRKLAKDLGVDLTAIIPSGPDATIVRADVVAAADGPPEHAVANRIPIKGVRKHTAAAMVSSAFTAPHVTEFVTLDVTKTLELRDTIARRREFRDVKLTPLALIARAYLRALARTPMATARWDEEAQEIVVPAGIALGIAAATPRGLVVPNIKDAHTLDLLGLATAIDDLATTARAGKTTPEAMSGGTTTITNVGVFGVDTGTPILNPGETAILAVGAIRRQPWVVEDASGERIEPRSVLQLALSFDHRVLDGQQGSELLAGTAAQLTEPGLAVL